ncbi:helix-turn-helix domain-containing protein [Spartinivicinus ruber]|uniref:hypothetical protein n=1 Tax=Spartinivicinus ruber TaxID=2683272 RepID=UPI0013D2D637|nr:hypothetical protein [Spartinivicinus ruber]
MSKEILGNEVIGIQSQSLTETELQILVALADGKTDSQVEKELSTDITIASRPIFAKLGAKTKTHMMSRAFLLGVLLPRALSALLCLAMVLPDDGFRRERTRIRGSYSRLIV